MPFEILHTLIFIKSLIKRHNPSLNPYPANVKNMVSF